MTTRIVRCASLIPVVAASALLLGGCGSGSSDTSSTSASATASAMATTAAPTTTGTAAAITKEQAEQIAIGAVPGGTVANSEQQQRDGKAVWHVHIRDTRGYDYDVDVDAATGAVVPENQNGEITAAPAPAPPAGGAVTQQQAEQIAVATVPGGTVANAEEQKRDGKTVWHIHIRDAKGWDYDVNVDASTGAVVPDN
ncbi:MAG: peptidase [Rhodococcus sp. (in: high G+C Gram-positive bacteria)]|nr:MAG: peptidase [Rhodococcus sp. (in: high G+C Gram-positive bacteria)]